MIFQVNDQAKVINLVSEASIAIGGEREAKPVVTRELLSSFGKTERTYMTNQFRLDQF